MKNKNLLNLIGVLVFGLTMLTSCSNNDYINENNFDHSSLLDKWWYDSNNFTGDIYLHSDGEYQQTMLAGNEVTETENWMWSWEDENAGIMRVDVLGDNGQVVSSVWYIFSDIQKHTVTVQLSTNGIDYSSKIFFQDTDN